MTIKHKRRTPKPASEATVAHAASQYATAMRCDTLDPCAHLLFLDRIGFRNLDDPAAVCAISDPAAHALRDALADSPALAPHIIERLSGCDPSPRRTPRPAVAMYVGYSRLTVAYQWLAQVAGRAATALPDTDPRTPAYLEFLACHPLNNNRDGAALRRALLNHPACPPDVLYTAALGWPLDQAALADTHPNATPETRVALALRQ